MSTAVSSPAAAPACGPVEPSCRPSSAHLSDYPLGGKDHDECDRQLTAELSAVAPWLERAEHLDCRFARHATAVAAARGVDQLHLVEHRGRFAVPEPSETGGLR